MTMQPLQPRIQIGFHSAAVAVMLLFSTQEPRLVMVVQPVMGVCAQAMLDRTGIQTTAMSRNAGPQFHTLTFFDRIRTQHSKP
jgi:hypothetical protein